MNEEINKIIKDLEFCDDLFDYTINPKQCKILLNYINDLEQEKNKIIFDSNGLINANGILQQENERLKDKIKDLEEWLEVMASMYENEYKDVNASEHYKCMLHKLKEN